MQSMLTIITAGFAAPVVALALAFGTGDNELSKEESAAGWKLLFDGKTLDGWKAALQATAFAVESGNLACNGKGGGWIYFEKEQFGDFELRMDFKVSPGANSGLFFRVGDPKDEVYTGIEMQILDSAAVATPGVHDCGAIYDLVAPKLNATKPAGEWNSVKLVCKGPKIDVEMNGKAIVAMNLDEWKEPKGKFPTAYAKMPRKGFIGMQDHGSPVWFRNIRIRPL
jgi:hypothetical protein